MRPVEVQDRASTGLGRKVEGQLAATLGRFAEAGFRVRRPVQATLELLGVPAFAETQFDRHVLHLHAGAAGEPWFPGLLAREVAHAALTDLGHPSHDPGLLQVGFAAAKERSKALPFLARVAALNHHVRDVYAEDLAAFVDPEALGPFLDHLAAQAASVGGPDGAVEAGYAAGSLRRRGAPAPPALQEALRAAAAEALAGAIAALHPDPEPEELERALAGLVALVPEG